MKAPIVIGKYVPKRYSYHEGPYSYGIISQSLILIMKDYCNYEGTKSRVFKAWITSQAVGSTRRLTGAGRTKPRI